MRPFTLVSTIFNEAARLQDSLDDIENQSLRPNEIVVVDAGSKDGTLQILTEWQKKSSVTVVILVDHGCNVAKGRNMAIENSTNNLIVSTDFGCRYHKDWLKSIINLFNDETVEVVGGNYTVDEHSINTISSRAAYYLSSKFDFELDNNFIPSSRSIAYKKYVWKKCHGYPEWLTLAADDYVFGLKFKKLGFKLTVAQQPYVYWLRHSSFLGYFKEANRYGLGDGEAQVNQRNFISNSIQLMLRYFFIFSIPALFMYPHYALIGIIMINSLGFRSYLDAIRKWLRFDSYHSLKLLFAMFYMIEGTRIYYIKGYLKGVLDNTKKRKSGLSQLKKFLK